MNMDQVQSRESPAEIHLIFVLAGCFGSELGARRVELGTISHAAEKSQAVITALG